MTAPRLTAAFCFIAACLTVEYPAAAPLSLGSAQSQLFTNNLDVLTAQTDVQKSKDELAEARSAWWPSADASASYSYLTEKSKIQINPGEIIQLPPGASATPKQLSVGSNSNTLFGADITYPFFTGFSRYYNVSGKENAVAEKKSIA